MAHDVFISHSSKDKVVADATCAWLERHGIRCWVAPRDIRPGETWGGSIVKAIRSSRVMVLIFSGHANASPQIMREVERAVNAGITLIPVRIEDVAPEGDLDYFLSASHWLDAFHAPLEHHFDQLAAAIQEVLKLAPRIEPAAPVSLEPADAVLEKHAPTAQAPVREPAIAPAPSSNPTARKPPKKSRFVSDMLTLLGVVAGAILLFAGFLAFVLEDGKTETNSKAATDQKATDVTAAAPNEAAWPKDGQPWTNSSGMKFVPAGTNGVLFCIWDVRVKDFKEFVDATGYEVPEWHMDSLGSDGLWKDHGATWKSPGFAQAEDSPVIGLYWKDADAFCQWLTDKDRKEGILGPNQSYRLPKEIEWSKAVGGGKYPWGDVWPPPDGSGNYADEAFAASLPGTEMPHLHGNDGYPRTSPVGSFPPNAYGLYDMGGNVLQWCEDKFDNGYDYRVLRGLSWEDCPQELISSVRDTDPAWRTADDYGFRVVVVVSPRVGG